MRLNKIQVVKCRGKEEYIAFGLSSEGEISPVRNGRGPTLEAAVVKLLIGHGTFLEIEVENLGEEPEMTTEQKKERIEGELNGWKEYAIEQCGRELTKDELARKRALLEAEFL